jgi:hypothetical protein
MGAGRRDRERPDLKPISAAEVLWYRGLIGKAFLDFSTEPQEYAYIPDEFLEFIQPSQPAADQPPGRPASQNETAHPIPASDRILDDACTLLSAIRLGLDPQTCGAEWSVHPAALTSLLQTSGLIDFSQTIQPESARAFLEAPRAEALNQLAQEWFDSNVFDELRLLPGIKCEGEWKNDPVNTRGALIEFLSQVPQNTWWSINAFVSYIHDRSPEFQRPSGDYDTWFIKEESSGAYLRGFSNWDKVEGALIRYLINGPLFWLGFVDLAAPEPGATPTAFRFSRFSEALWHGQSPVGLPAEEALLKVSSDGRLLVPTLVPRIIRYQIARFCDWEPQRQDGYHYRITPQALDRARQQGLRTNHLTGLLRKHAVQPLPPALLQALERWDKSGVQASMTKVSLLRVNSPEIMQALQKSRAARYLAEILTPTIAILRPGSEETMRNALVENGFLGEIKEYN